MDAPSERTPSSECGETTTIGLVRCTAPMIAALTAWRRFVPTSARRRLRPLRAAYVDRRRRRPPKLGDLRRTTPIDPNWGFERGTPIDRVYVERFLAGHADDIRGRVLEIAAPDYTNRYGRGVEQVDIVASLQFGRLAMAVSADVAIPVRAVAVRALAVRAAVDARIPGQHARRHCDA